MLSPAGAITGVAHTLLLEAIRQRISLACICGLLVLLPLLPLFISSRDPLRYQVQTFIARGTGLVFLVAAFLTLLLACATVAFEIRDRQIWSVLTKPVTRFQYLIGKWLGLAVLDAVILLIGGVAVLVQVSLLSARQAGSVEDAAALNSQVLVARASERPAYKSIDPIELRDSVNREIENDSVLRGEIEAGAKSESDVVRQLRVQRITEFSTAQRTIAAGASRSYSFSGLLEARKAGISPMLRYCFHSGPDSSHEVYPVSFLFGELPPELVEYVPVVRNVIAIPVEAIADDGTLKVTIVNGAMMPAGRVMPAPWSMNFDADGLEVLHRVGGFEGNFLRAMLVDWGKLLFIAALGVSAAGILSFPVAVLVAVTIFVIGSMAPFLEVAVEQFAVPIDAPWFMQVFEAFIHGFVGGVQWLLAPFASVGSSTDLVDGRVIPWGSVLRAVGLIGLLWSALAFTIGGLAFSRKEIAIYSGGEG
jgi:ABC-type transport system involved in multi-copper enzyme maturation permease subunit